MSRVGRSAVRGNGVTVTAIFRPPLGSRRRAGTKRRRGELYGNNVIALAKLSKRITFVRRQTRIVRLAAVEKFPAKNRINNSERLFRDRATARRRANNESIIVREIGVTTTNNGVAHAGLGGGSRSASGCRGPRP